MFGRGLTVAVTCSLLAACDNGGWQGDLPAPDVNGFATAAYPVLLRDCGFNTCHGDPARFFHVYGPGRARMDPLTKPADPATPAEVAYSYERTRAMLATDATLDGSLLLRKPLETSAGGQGHKGVDAFGHNVYRSASEPGYVTLASWARAMQQVALPPAGAGGGTP